MDSIDLEDINLDDIDMNDDLFISFDTNETEKDSNIEKTQEIKVVNDNEQDK